MSENDISMRTAEPPSPEEGWQPRDIIIAIIAFALIIALAVGGYFIYEAKKTPPLLEGDMAPDFTLETLDGRAGDPFRPARQGGTGQYLGHLVRTMP